ncbi:MAG: glycosyltransferase family 39 protein [Acidobacteria bacterium]|nr:glycosyltransferase family 39 protein [Acidobacteriota bacterium]
MRIKSAVPVYALRRYLGGVLATQETFRRRTKLILALLIFLLSFATKSLQAVDLASVMYTAEQPFGGLTDTYDSRAVGILNGEGLLGPYDINPRRTVWIAQAPGYPVFLSAVYKLTSRDFYKVQLLQNLLNSLSPVLIFFIAGRLISWRVGMGVGLLAALSHHLSHISNFILPDALCALPILAAVYLLCLTRSVRRYDYWLFAAAGFLFGIATWLRPQPMLLAPFFLVMLLLISTPRRRLLKRAALMMVVALAVIAPITIKNYVVYGEFIPVSIGTGLNLWEGLGEASNYAYGTVAKDEEVAEQDAIYYGQPRYAGAWSTPDGIKRDRDHVKRSLAIITAHPVWYAGVMLRRIRDMMKYSAHAPLVAKPVEAQAQALQTQENPPLVKTNWQEIAAQSRLSALEVGRKLFWLRPLFRSLQRVTKEAMQTFIVLGVIVVFLLSRRRAALLLIVPLYYFIFQAFMHTEFRYTLPMQYFLFTFAAVGWVVLVTLLIRGIVKIANKTGPFRAAP